jgi:hypothetical protein
MFIRSMALDAARRLNGSRVALSVAGERPVPFVAQIFSEALLGAGKAVLTREEPGADRLRVEAAESGKYTVLQRDSLYLHTIELRIGATAESGETGRVLWSRAEERIFTDTLRSADLARELPPEGGRGAGFFSSVLEPLLVAATAAVIVILLFTVRGS